MSDIEKHTCNELAEIFITPPSGIFGWHIEQNGITFEIFYCPWCGEKLEIEENE